MTETIIGKQYPEKIIPKIDEAKQSLDICVFDWRWYPQDPGASVQLFNQAIVRAVRRGLKVRAIANNDQIITILKGVGVEAKRLKTANLVHAKFIIFDNRLLCSGSHNFTQSAFTMNHEVSVLMEHQESVNAIQTYFNNLWQN